MSEKYCNFAIDHEGKTDELLEKLSAEQQERIYCKPPEGYATPKTYFRSSNSGVFSWLLCRAFSSSWASFHSGLTFFQ